MGMPSFGSYPDKQSIRPLATDYWDSPTDATTVTIAGFSVVRAATNARLKINVPVGCTSVYVRAIGNMPDLALPIGFYVDGIWNQAMFVPVGETFLHILGIQFDGTHTHTLEIWLSFLQYASQELLIYDVSGRGIKIIQPSTVVRRIATYGDSIISGGLSTPNTQLGVIARLRASTAVSFAQYSSSGWRLYDDSGTGGGQLGFANHTLLAERFANLLSGATIGDVYLAIGINDVLSGPYTSAQFGTSYSDLLDKIHTRLPSAKIYCQTMLITLSSEATAIPFRAAIATAVSGRAYCTLITGTTLVSVLNLADGVHPNTAGHAEYATNLQPILLS